VSGRFQLSSNNLTVINSMQQKLEQIHTAIESVQKSITLDRSFIPHSANVVHPRRKTRVTNHDHSRNNTHHRSQRSSKYKTTELEAGQPRKSTSKREGKSRATVSPVEDADIFDNKNDIMFEGSSGNPESSHQDDTRQNLEFTSFETSIQGSENQKTVPEHRFQLATPLKNASYGSRLTRYSTEDDNSSSNLSVGKHEEEKHVSRMPHAESDITKSSSIETAANKETEAFTWNFLDSDIKHNSASSDDNSSTRSSLRSRSIAPDDQVEDHNCSAEFSSNFQDEAEEPRYSST
jgi:hypothetical protein